MFKNGKRSELDWIKDSIKNAMDHNQQLSESAIANYHTLLKEEGEKEE